MLANGLVPFCQRIPPGDTPYREPGTSTTDANQGCSSMVLADRRGLVPAIPHWRRC